MFNQFRSFLNFQNTRHACCILTSAGDLPAETWECVVEPLADYLANAAELAGIILIIAGYAKLGQIIKFIPHPVVMGCTPSAPMRQNWGGE